MLPDIPSKSASSVPPAIIKAAKEFSERTAPTFQIARFSSLQFEMTPDRDTRLAHFPS
jgi:hypothetical protein